MCEEIWKDVEGYGGKYQVSNEGRVKANYRTHSKILKQYLDEYGYFQLALCKNSKHTWFRVHRLVANAFLPNPDNLPFVNHKDENRSNNVVTNLEWCTPKYNVNYGNKQLKTAITYYNKYLKDSDEMNKKSTRYFSNKQEKSVAKAVNGKKVANSGATTFSKGDVRTDDFLIEAKTKTSPSESMTIHKEWIVKNDEEAFAMGKQYSAVAIDFGEGENYYIISEKLFKKLINFIQEEEENG